ncbi:MAG: hypothetical protein AAB444_01435 [Patescibacteria group bacterium]
MEKEILEALATRTRRTPYTKRRSVTAEFSEDMAFQSPPPSSPRQTSGSGSVLGKWATALSRFTLYALLFLSPFFFLPWVSNSVYLGKQFLAACLLSLAALLFTVKVLAGGESFTYAKMSGGFLLFLLGVVSAVSAYLSGARSLSFWGFGGSEPFAGISIILIMLFYFLSLIYFHDTRVREKVVVLFGYGSLVLFLGSLVAILGAGLFHLEFFVRLFGSAGWNPFGTPNALALFAATVFSYAAGYLLMGGGRSGRESTVWVLNVILGTLLMLVIGFRLAYLVAAISMVVLLGLSFARFRGEFVRRSNLVLLGTVFFLALFLFKISLASLVAFPAEVGPNVRLSFQIGVSSMTESVKNLIIGSGPSTFAYDYARYRPEELNQTALWNVRFTSGYAALPTLMAELGFLGVLSLAIFLVFQGVRFLKGVLAADDKGAASITAAFLGTLAGIVSLGAYPISFVSFLYLMFFVALGVTSLARAQGLERTFSFAILSHKALLVSLAIICLFLGSLFLLLTTTRHLVAEVYYSSAVRAYLKQDTDKGFDRFNKAVQWYNDDEYSRTYAVALTETTLNQSQDEKADPALLQAGFQNAIGLAQRATVINPKDRENWLVLGSVYERLIGVMSGAETAAQDAYRKIEELEPASPLSHLALGRVSLTAAKAIQGAITSAQGRQGTDQKAIGEATKRKDALVAQAREELQKAQEKKPNFEAVYLLWAQLEEFLGDKQKALEKIIEARKLNAPNLDSLFTLGRLYYETAQYENARAAFENIVKASPEHRNGLLYLTLAYDKTGMKNKGIETIRKLAVLEPENTLVKEIQRNLEAGRDALSGAGLESSVTQTEKEGEPIPSEQGSGVTGVRKEK